MLKIVRLESQIMLMHLEAIKPKGTNRIAKIDYGHLSLIEEILRFDETI
jgi:hypothetical protein